MKRSLSAISPKSARESAFIFCITWEIDAGAARIAAKFHNALATWIVGVARIADVRDVVLSGGVFQNAYLAERTSALLGEHGFRAFTHHQVPANDGGLSLGQAVLAG